MKIVLFFIPLFFILALVQTSFLVHFSLGGFILPLVFLAVFAIALFEPPTSSAALQGSVIGGVFLDAVSSYLFGFWTLMLVLLSLAIRHIVLPYVRFPIFKNS